MEVWEDLHSFLLLAPYVTSTSSISPQFYAISLKFPSGGGSQQPTDLMCMFFFTLGGSLLGSWDASMFRIQNRAGEARGSKTQGNGARRSPQALWLVPPQGCSSARADLTTTCCGSNPPCASPPATWSSLWHAWTGPWRRRRRGSPPPLSVCLLSGPPSSRV